MPASSNMYQLIWQTRRLFQRLRATSEELLEGSGINASQRAVLEFLNVEEPQTVPQIARGKTVSRQHIQMVVNSLLELGLVEVLENPVHKRSQLVQATAAGKTLFSSVLNKEALVLKEMEKNFLQRDLTIACRVLESLDSYLASGDWRPSD
jgi:DNA-binding MarR family transcriptional regulator